MKVKAKDAVAFVLFSLSFVFLCALSQTLKIQRDSMLDVNRVATRVALDLEMLPIADPLFNYGGDKQRTELYVQKLNAQLRSSQSRVVLQDIQSIDRELSDENSYFYLKSAHRNVALKYTVNHGHSWAAYAISLLLSVLTCACFLKLRRGSKGQEQQTHTLSVKESSPNLVIDLHDKCLSLSVNRDEKVQLANKPLCFYLALAEFCHANPEVILNPNKEVPDELINIADRYFDRLITLGHTIRKKPNFSNSLEKTLSEVRAALDEVFVKFPELKTKYYPPKAYGEGSRSKLHSYGLADISPADITVIGK